jgi:hypothetical protein
LYTLFKAKKKTVGQNRKREKYQKGEKRKMSLASKVTGTDCGTGTGTGTGTGNWYWCAVCAVRPQGGAQRPALTRL